MGETEKLENIKIEALKCKKCPLHETRHNVVFGEGNFKNRIMFIGEAPGFNEDMQGKPFVGRAGTFLNELLKDAGLEREDIYITNILKCRPPNNRDPTEEEIKLCSPYLNNQIKVIKPKLIITLGNYSTKYILKMFSISPQSISRIHGQIYEVNNLFYHLKIIPSYHPAAALYNPNMRNTIKNDFKTIGEEANRIIKEEQK